MSDLPDLNTLLTASEGARYAGVTRYAVSKWRARGHLTPAEYDQAGRPLYRLIDLAKAEHATRKRARRLS